jgi:3-oxoacyl-[acyl-carrier protein] reductase
MNLGIKGRTALVLGGGGGLGRAIALALAGEGVKIALADIAADALKESVAAVVAEDGKAHGIVWDLADLKQIDAHVGEIENTLGPVDRSIFW